MYVDVFDPPRSAHPKQRLEQDLLAPRPEDIWWRPETLQDQSQACNEAEASAMVRLLHGDTISLSQSQALDSPAWLRIAHRFKSDWPYLRIAFLEDGEVREAPDDLRAKAIDMFTRQAKGLYSSAAWCKITPQQTAEMAGKLTSGTGFRAALEHIGRGIPQDAYEVLYLQADALDHVTQLLEDNRDIRYRTAVGGSLWHESKALTENLGFAKELSELEGVAVKTGRNARSQLYDAILKMSNSWQRERCIVIREAIDQTYNKIVCRSVNSGTGLFSVSSMKGSHTHEELADSLRTIEVDECTTSEILCAPLHYFSGAADCLSKALDWSDVEAFVSDPACRVRAAALQRALCSSDPSMRQDMLAAHHEFLSDRLSNKVWTAPCQRGTVLNLLVDCAAPGLQAIVGGALGFLIGGPIGSAAGAGIAAGLPIPLGIQWTEKLHGEIQGGVLRGFTRRALARSVT